MTMRKAKIFTALLAMLGINGCLRDNSMNDEIHIANFPEPQVAALVRALIAGDGSKVKELASAGVDLDSVGLYESTPVAVSIETNNLKMLELLLELGADPNFITPKEISAAEHAASHKKPGYLRLMLESGLDPNIKSWNKPIIFFAIENNRWQQFDMLVEAGADVLNTKTEDESTVALYLAMQFEYERLKSLIEKGADVKTPAKSGLSVVGNIAKMQKRFGSNPEHPAYKARVEIIEMLRNKGIEIPPGIPGVEY